VKSQDKQQHKLSSNNVTSHKTQQSKKN